MTCQIQKANVDYSADAIFIQKRPLRAKHAKPLAPLKTECKPFRKLVLCHRTESKRVSVRTMPGCYHEASSVHRLVLFND